MLRSSCATQDFWGGKIYTKFFDCVFQTSSRLCEFGTNFNNVFYSFWYFTLVAEPVDLHQCVTYDDLIDSDLCTNERL